MPANHILPFAEADGANVIDDATYAALPARTAGFQPGVASSQQLNKVWRQAAFIASMIGEFIKTQAVVDVNDDGDISTLLAHFNSAVAAAATGGIGPATWLNKTANYTANSGDLIRADTSGGPFTVTLPASPTADVTTVRVKGNFLTNNLTIAGNGHTFDFGASGTSASYTLNADGLDITVLFDGTHWVPN